MAHVDIKMHVRDGSLATHKQHGVLLDKALHEFIRPGKIAGDLRCVLENIEQKDAEIKRPCLHLCGGNRQISYNRLPY